jgi:hypothetical protein
MASIHGTAAAITRASGGAFTDPFRHTATMCAADTRYIAAFPSALVGAPKSLGSREPQATNIPSATPVTGNSAF